MNTRSQFCPVLQDERYDVNQMAMRLIERNQAISAKRAATRAAKEERLKPRRFGHYDESTNPSNGWAYR